MCYSHIILSQATFARVRDKAQSMVPARPTPDAALCVYGAHGANHAQHVCTRGIGLNSSAHHIQRLHAHTHQRA